MRELRPERDLRIPIERCYWRDQPRRRFGVNIARGAFFAQYDIKERHLRVEAAKAREAESKAARLAAEEAERRARQEQQDRIAAAARQAEQEKREAQRRELLVQQELAQKERRQRLADAEARYQKEVADRAEAARWREPALGVIKIARQAGVHFTVEGDQLIWHSPILPDPHLLDLFRAYGPEIKAIIYGGQVQ